MNRFTDDFGKNRGPTFLNTIVADYEAQPPGHLDCEPLLLERDVQGAAGPGSTNSQLQLLGPVKGQVMRAASQVCLAPQPVIQPLPTSLRLDHVQILNNFIAHCLPSSWSPSQEVPLEWLLTVTSTTNDHRALAMAMSALGMGWAGHSDGQSTIIGNGLEHYVAAVGALRKDVSHSSPLQVLSTISLLTLYELYEFGSEFSRGWITHLNGAKKIIKLLGPTAISNPPYLQLFSFYRTIEVSCPSPDLGSGSC